VSPVRFTNNLKNPTLNLESPLSHLPTLLPTSLPTSRRALALQGMRDQMPGIIGLVPFGLITGAASGTAGLDPWLSMFMSVIVFAGAAQLVAIQLMSQHAPALIVVVTVLVINLRMVMYSAAIAPLVNHLPKRKKWLMGYLLTDHSFALMVSQFGAQSSNAATESRPIANIDAYYFGAAGAMWFIWQIAVAIGIFAGTLVPADWSLDFAIPLVFLSLVLPALHTRAHWGAAITASIAAAFTTSFPLKLGLISAALIGVIVGVVLDRRDAQASKAGR
jgi:predicted branched-subunit amino acid permease